MRRLRAPWLILSVVAAAHLGCAGRPTACWTGAFLADRPTERDIERFHADFGKKPFLVLVFVDWNHLPDERMLRDIHSMGCALVITWEPWDAATQQGIDTRALVAGQYDAYLAAFAERLRACGTPVFLRFAHEMNGDWYPWSGKTLGPDRYKAIWRYTKHFLDRHGAAHAQWIFAVNWEDVPATGNHVASYYPGGAYVDFVGVDGYNWGTVKDGMRWMSFREMFTQRCAALRRLFRKPILITECGSTSRGGDKAQWIHDALTDMKRMTGLAGFILFNVDKETDWSFRAGRPETRALQQAVADPFFSDADAR